MVSACEDTMGLADLTVEQWNERLSFRCEYLAECGRPFNLAQGTAQLQEAITYLVAERKPLTPNLQRLFTAAVQLEYDLARSGMQSPQTRELLGQRLIEDIDDKLGTVIRVGGSVWRQSHPVLLQGYQSDLRHLELLALDVVKTDRNTEGGLEIAVTPVALDTNIFEDSKRVESDFTRMLHDDLLLAEGFVVAGKVKTPKPAVVFALRNPVIFTYLPQPALIHTAVIANTAGGKLKVLGAYIYAEESVEATNQRHFAGSIETQRRRDFEEIMVVEALDNFNLYVLRRLFEGNDVRDELLKSLAKDLEASKVVEQIVNEHEKKN